MEKVTVWYLILDAGDGSAYLSWHLTKKDLDKRYQEESDNFNAFAECCYGEVETFVGSNIHKKAIDIENEDED